MPQSDHPPGEQRLRIALRRRRDPPREKDPQPYDNDWGWWIEHRLSRLETSIKWLIGLAAATLAAEVIRITLNTFGLVP